MVTAPLPSLIPDHQNLSPSILVSISISATSSSNKRTHIALAASKLRITMNLNKSKLQEMCQARGWTFPKYSSNQQGPPHRPRFSASVLVHGFTFNTKTMLTSKKEAECCAAGLALDYFDENPQPPQPKRTKCFSFPAQPSHIPSLPPPSSPGNKVLEALGLYS